jgi:hypothetical protein
MELLKELSSKIKELIFMTGYSFSKSFFTEFLAKNLQQILSNH